MATKVKVKPLDLEDPAWSVATAKPGDEVELSVTAKKLEAGQTVELEIRDEQGVVAVISKTTAAGDKQKAKWIVPNLPGAAKLTFDATIREKPTPKNGHITARGRITSPKLAVQGFKVTIKSLDTAFAPKAEKLEVHFKVDNGGGVKLKGRYEIWGERYPSGKPLFKGPFDPAAGDMTWNAWDGTANAGTLSGKTISPEFSPYRVRVIIGIDDASVDDPFGVGKGKVCLSERPFEVLVESLHLRLQNGLAAGTLAALKSFLAVEPRDSAGKFKAQGALPKVGETCRMRVPCATHTMQADALSGAGDLVSSAYLDSGDPTKWKRDSGIHSRPELPLEIEPRLRSRTAARNAAPDHGVFVKEAIGKLRIEPFAEDVYHEALYKGPGAIAAYLRNAAHKVKRGSDTAPVHAGTKPIIGYWQARYEVKKDGVRDIDLHALDADFKYKKGSSELTVYLNRARLLVGAPGTKGVDVEETDATHIKLKAKLAKKGDIVWIVRDDSGVKGSGAPNEITSWSKFIPSANCHDHYGGIRGAGPNNLFLADFSAAAAPPKQPIIGQGTPWPYKAGVNLDPDDSKGAQERVETTALDSGANQGLAGILFSPSYIAGDSYVLGVKVAPIAYDRTLGAFTEEPVAEVKTGVLSVWRLMTISQSLRMPDKGTRGMLPTVGNPPEAAIGSGSRKYRGDGVHMNMTHQNAELEPVFNEWQVPEIVAPATEIHQDILPATYIAAHDASIPAAAGAGKVAIGAGNANKITNQFVQFDPYRQRLPPGTPPGARAGITALINGKPKGTPSLTIAGLITPAMLAAAAAPAGITVSALSVSDYSDWVDGIVTTTYNGILDQLTVPVATVVSPVKAMTVVRWPELYQSSYWIDGAPAAAGPNAGSYTGANVTNTFTTGFCRGSSQSYFATKGADDGTYEHEMGHSLHLVHFAAQNFEWKHHDLNYPQCKMSYDFTHGYIPQPAGTVGPVGAGATEDTGWPDTIPSRMDATLVPPQLVQNIPQNSPAPTNPPAAPNAPTIEITVLAKAAGHGLLALDTFCAKCALKLRGWKDDLLPVAWRHPDLF